MIQIESCCGIVWHWGKLLQPRGLRSFCFRDCLEVFPTMQPKGGMWYTVSNIQESPQGVNRFSGREWAWQLIGDTRCSRLSQKCRLVRSHDKKEISSSAFPHAFGQRGSFRHTEILNPRWSGHSDTIFLKGCPLHCEWCHNPEGISTAREVMFWEARCMRCGTCQSFCAQNAILPTPDGGYFTDRERCVACGECE